MTEHTTRQYANRQTGAAAIGRWTHGDGCATLGEVTILTATSTLRFSSSTIMTVEGLAGYTTAAYLERHAAKFQARSERY